MSYSAIGRYQIKQELGRGGMAIVYLAHDPAFGRDVALKIMPHALLHDPSFRTRFSREAKTIATLEHAAIVPVYDYGEHEGQPYLVMRYMHGGSLAEQMGKRPFSLPKTAVILTRLAAALDKAHTQGVVHRDLKPGNILFDDEGNAYLSDFGIAKIVEQTTTLTGSGVIGTPAYMSPEQAQGSRNVDRRADIYALGTIVFEMLTGQQPYQADTPIGVVVKHITEPVPNILQANPTLPPQCDTLIQQAMAKEPDKRYRSAGELAAVLSGLTAVSPPPPPPPPDTKTTIEPLPPRPPVQERDEPTAVIPPPPTPLTLPRWGWVAAALLLLALVGWGIANVMDNGNGATTPTATAKSNVVDFPAAATATAPAATPKPATPSPAPEATATQLVNATTANTATATTTSETAVFPSKLRITANSVNIRSGPGTAYPVVTTLPQGSEVTLIARDNQADWYNVELADGQRGWVAASVVEPVGEGDLTAVPIAQTIPAPPAPTVTPPPSGNTGGNEDDDDNSGSGNSGSGNSGSGNSGSDNDDDDDDSGSGGGNDQPTPEPENTVPPPP